jgi:Cu/Ag efflux protein CusF
MKRTATSLLCALAAMLVLSCQKQQTETKSPSPSHTPTPGTFAGPPGFPPPVMNKSYPGTGVVVTINRNESWIEINHEEIKDLMPAMQMEFNVKDKSLLDKVKTGDRVEFTIVETEKGEYLTELKKVSPP